MEMSDTNLSCDDVCDYLQSNIPGCTYLLEALDIEKSVLGYTHFSGNLQDILLGVRLSVPRCFAALLTNLSGVPSESRRSILLCDEGSVAHWGEMLRDYADVSMISSVVVGAKNVRKRAQLVAKLEKYWNAAETNHTELVTASLELIRELARCGLLPTLAPAECNLQKRLQTKALKVCVFLAENDVFLDLKDDSWRAIYSMTEAQFESCYRVLVINQLESMATIVSSIHQCLQQLNVPIYSETFKTMTDVCDYLQSYIPGCTYLLEALDIEKSALGYTHFSGNLQDILLGVRLSVPRCFDALLTNLSGVPSESRRSILLCDEGSVAHWGEMLRDYADVSMISSVVVGAKNVRKRAQLVAKLEKYWNAAETNHTELVTASLELIRELARCGLLPTLAPAECNLQKRLQTKALKVCVFLAENDVFLDLKDDSWRAIYSMTEAQFESCYRVLVINQLKSMATIVSSIHQCLQQLKVPIYVEIVYARDSVVESFNANYVDDFKNVPRFVGHLTQCVGLHYSKIEGGNFESPYTVITQASGMGKSRLISESAKEIPTIYVSFANPKGSAFPRPTIILANEFSWGSSLFDHNKDVPLKKVCNILIAAIRLYVESNFDAEKMFAAQNIACNNSSLGTWLTTHQETSLNTTNALVILRQEAQLLMKKLKEQGRIQVDAYNGTGRDDPKTFTLLLALDEARELLNSVQLKSTGITTTTGSTTTSTTTETSTFRILRKVLQKIGLSLMDLNFFIFAVFIDTSSKISNFFPALAADPSSRVITKGPDRLHKPFWLVVNNNLFYEKLLEASKPSSASPASSALSFVHLSTSSLSDRASDLLKKHFSKQVMYCLGRPLWYSLDHSDEDRVDFAISKLLGGTFPRKLSDVTLSQQIAVLNTRVPILLHSYGALNESLPAQHMRTIIGISEDRELVFSEYVPEPALAAASQALMKRYGFQPYYLLQALRKSISNSLVDGGGIGERIVALMYILARDQACDAVARLATLSDWAEYRQVTVQQLLMHLHRSAVDTLMQQKVSTRNSKVSRKSNLDRLLQGLLSFSQFSDILYTPSRHQLLEGYLIGAAFMCRRGQAGVDLIIPVLLPEESTIDVSDATVNTRKGKSTPAQPKQLHRSGVFLHSESILFEDLPPEKMSSTDVHFGDLDNMRKLAKARLLSARLFTDPNELDSVLRRISYILVQVKNRTEDSSRETDSGISPETAGIYDQDALLANMATICQTPYLSVKHVLRSDKASISTMQTDKPLQYGLILNGFNGEQQSSLGTEVATLMRQVVDTVDNPCLTVGDTLDDRFAMTYINATKYLLDLPAIDTSIPAVVSCETTISTSTSARMSLSPPEPKRSAGPKKQKRK